MNQTLARYREQLRRLNSEFTAGQKAMVVLAVAVVLVGALFFSKWTSNSTNVVLYSGLSAEDAAAVTSELQSQGVKYELSANGTTVLVDQSKAAQVRVDLAAKSIPSGSDGWSIIEKEGMTTSDFRQRIDYQRALEGELSRTIEAMGPVNDAIVRLVVPRSDVFAADNQKSTASVLVTTKPGQTLSATQVQAVVNMVAGSVPGLKPEDVTVTDSNGNLLAAPGMISPSVSSDANNQATATFEKKVAGDITSLLNPVFGTGKVHVQVSSQMNFDKTDTIRETVEAPDPAVVTNEKTVTETLQGDGAVGGVLGPDGLPVTGGANNNYSKNAAERTFAVGKVTQTIKGAPGAIERMSVAVVVDETVAQNVDMAQVSDLIAAAAGLNADRGDVVQVTRIPFDTTAAADAQKAIDDANAAKSQDQLMGLVRTVAVWLIVALVVFFIWRSIRKARAAQLAVARELEPDPMPVVVSPEPVLYEPEPEPVPTEEELAREVVVEKVRTAAEVLRNAPTADLAAIMRNWAQEG